MKEILKTFYAYNSWATGVLLDSLARLDESQIDAPGCSGHGSIRNTLYHLMNTQYRWFVWFDKSMSLEASLASQVPADAVQTIDSARSHWEAIDKRATDLIESLTQEQLLEEWSFKIPGSNAPTSLAFWKMLLHVANHGTHTRAQIVAAIRREGFDPGVYEFLKFALMNRK